MHILKLTSFNLESYKVFCAKLININDLFETKGVNSTLENSQCHYFSILQATTMGLRFTDCLLNAAELVNE